MKNVAEIRLSASTALLGSATENCYLIRESWVWPTYTYGDSISPTLKINGYGAVLYSDVEDITVISRLPTAQDTGPTYEQAQVMIGLNKFSVEGVVLRGEGHPGQTGFAIGATYGLRMIGCRVAAMGRGFVGAFCLQSYWEACETINCEVGGFYLTDGSSATISGVSWPGASNSGSQSNVSVLQSCRVYGHPDQDQAYYLYGSDSCALKNCVAEGAGGAIDVVFDYGGSTVVKNFTIDGMHFENANAKCLMKIRTTGVLKIKGIFSQVPAALLDLSGGIGPKVCFDGLPYFVVPTSDPANPNNRLFFKNDGNGYGAVSEYTGGDGGTYYEFLNIRDGYSSLKDPAWWEGGTLPFAVSIANGGVSGGGTLYWARIYTLDVQDPVFVGNSVRPSTDNAYSLGAGAFRWSEVYAGSGTINTSDARIKTAVTPLADAEADAGYAMLQEIGLYKFLSAIEEKGEANARKHLGMTVQRAIEILSAHGLDPFSYSFICYDTWDAEPAVMSEPAPGEDPETFVPEVIKPGREAGDLYSFRREDLILFMLAGLVKKLALP